MDCHQGEEHDQQVPHLEEAVDHPSLEQVRSGDELLLAQVGEEGVKNLRLHPGQAGHLPHPELLLHAVPYHILCLLKIRVHIRAKNDAGTALGLRLVAMTRKYVCNDNLFWNVSSWYHQSLRWDSRELCSGTMQHYPWLAGQLVSGTSVWSSLCALTSISLVRGTYWVKRVKQ